MRAQTPDGQQQYLYGALGLNGNDEGIIQIGRIGIQTSAYIAGIYDPTASSAGMAVVVDSSGKLRTDSLVGAPGPAAAAAGATRADRSHRGNRPCWPARNIWTGGAPGRTRTPRTRGRYRSNRTCGATGVSGPCGYRWTARPRRSTWCDRPSRTSWPGLRLPGIASQITFNSSAETLLVSTGQIPSGLYLVQADVNVINDAPQLAAPWIACDLYYGASANNLYSSIDRVYQGGLYAPAGYSGGYANFRLSGVMQALPSPTMMAGVWCKSGAEGGITTVRMYRAKIYTAMPITSVLHGQ